MNPLRTICLLMGIFALAYAKSGSRSSNSYNRRNSNKNSVKPTDWLSPSELESLPALNELTVEKLERMSLEEGADTLNKLYHLSQIDYDFEPSFVPKPSEIEAHVFTPNNQKISFKLNELPRIAQEQKDFGDEEVTVFITGLPQKTETIKKATRKLVQAYMQRYRGDVPQPSENKYDYSSEATSPTSSEEDYSTSWKNQNNKPTGNLVVVDLGSAIPNFKAYCTLDVEQTGAKIGDVLVKLTDKVDVPEETIHVIGSNIGAHVAGAAARQYTRETGHQFRRVTGLDPSKIYAKRSQSLTGLARGDAEFVDAIHTSAYGMGAPTRCGDVDFYPDGPTDGVAGAQNVVEASMRAVRYFAESVVPGNERNFPAVGATSLQQYRNQNGTGKRVYMGITTDYDVEGDFVLEVNAQSPFGRRTPAQKQKNYHNNHKPWKTYSNDYTGNGFRSNTMSPLKIVCVAVLLLAANPAYGNSILNKLRPSHWLSSSQLEQTPAVDEISLQKLEQLSLEKGAHLMQKIYHLAQINHDLKPEYVPSPSNIPCYVVKPSGKKVETTLDQLASTCKQQSNFGDDEVTIFITGLPATTETVKKANRKLIEAYLQRYNYKRQQPQKFDYSNEKISRTSSEEESSEWQNQPNTSGDLVIIDLGAKLNNFKRFALLDIEQTGEMIASAIVKVTEKCDVPDETIHIVAQGIAAHVAGAAGNEYTRQTGRQLRRITALDPSKVLAKNPHTLTGLSRGDAEFVDAIHTNVYGMGTLQRVGDADFYVNGPSPDVPGAQNIVEASMRATRYYAESVRPGHERNFPAVAANSLKEYKNKNGFGKRVYMGYDVDYDVVGDFILDVNSKSPFGKRAPAQKQNTYHGVHDA
ncbi:uncharacterized protein ACRADG_007027 [Cochliomyia hominivorax]